MSLEQSSQRDPPRRAQDRRAPNMMTCVEACPAPLGAPVVVVDSHAVIVLAGAKCVTACRAKADFPYALFRCAEPEREIPRSQKTHGLVSAYGACVGIEGPELIDLRCGERREDRRIQSQKVRRVDVPDSDLTDPSNDVDGGRNEMT